MLLILFVVIPVLTMALGIRSIRKANRITPRVPTFAPTSWMFLPERPARMHRRLRRSATMARAGAAVHSGGAGRGLPTIPDLADEIERRACGIDTQVVLASRASGPARWSMLNALESDVAEVEGLASRLVALTTTWSTVAATGPQPGSTQVISERLDALEQAMREIDQLSSGHPSLPQSTTEPAPSPIRKLRRGNGSDDRTF
jgi:hypothetical protein